MSAQHTPGPWAVSTNHHLVFGRKQGPGLEPIGFVYGPSFADDSEVGRSAIADCRLIAAAPDLLDAVREAENLLTKLWEIGFIEVDDGEGEMVNLEHAAERMEAAIAKATGEAQ